MANRIFVEKRPGFRSEADSLRRELNTTLGLDIKDLRLVAVYDLFGFSPELLESTRYAVFGEKATDTVSDSIDTEGVTFLAVEPLPGQFDQRADAAAACVRLIQPGADIDVTSARMYIFDRLLSPEERDKVARYLINAVENREKDLSRLELPARGTETPVEVLDGFRTLDRNAADALRKEMGLAMSTDDLLEAVRYFSSKERDPSETEIRILDTYWSDHCRHTTFTTNLTDIKVEEGLASEAIKEALADWKEIRRQLGRERKPLCLMDLATIGARVLKRDGLLDDLEQSEENNACSIYVDVDVDGAKERWLLQFKNETHNHPTEIEPFGGASTCLGGAIRDPLSGRAYVYQAMRVTGAGDIWQPVAETLKGKLPQRVITLSAAAGYSSYGNQIGLATTHVREIYHPGYVAKRLEVGAVVGAVKASDVRRESPAPGDVVLMFGGRTGRDGIGGATGSSKEHTLSSLEECGSEVQKGNAPEERKIERLFRRPEVTRLIKKSNDFGAGGVSVAIGELTDGLDIYLDRVPTKYSGLNATELAISESQERMSVVVAPEDKEEFMKYCGEENLEVTHVADVTDTRRMRMYYGEELVADLSRDFIDSAGAPHYAEAVVDAVAHDAPFKVAPQGDTLEERMESLLASDNVTSQKGLIEMFDSSIGASTVMMPFGGKRQATESQVSVQKLPVGCRRTNTASMMAYGFDPRISSWSPFHGSAYAVVEAVAKCVAAGARYEGMRFSYQEYFEKMTSPQAWGKPLAALLGTLRMQRELGLPAIGGKDSMSGTFAELNVPPTLIAFGVAVVDADKVVSPEFKQAGEYIYIMRHRPLPDLFPDSRQLKENYGKIEALTQRGAVSSAWALVSGSLAEALAKMSFGNMIGAEVTVAEADLFDLSYGSIVLTSAEEIEDPAFEKIGVTVAEPMLTVNGHKMSLAELEEANRARFRAVYPDSSGVDGNVEKIEPKDAEPRRRWSGEKTEHPLVYLPVFPGTNCDYDMERAFRREGAQTKMTVFRNLSAADIEASVKEMAAAIDECHVLAISGGFSAGDEPDGSGKFIASVLRNSDVAAAIERLLERGGLVLGICNGFQALVKSGLLPDGKIGSLSEESPTLFRNDINRHISQMVTTRTARNNSPWLAGFEEGELHHVAASHGEGKFTCSDEMARRLAERGQIAFQYADAEGEPTMHSPENPNGSVMAIEGITSPDGLVLGKMAHSERYDDGLMVNIPGEKRQNLFRNAVRYFNF